jgi:hypothetical protein
LPPETSEDRERRERKEASKRAQDRFRARIQSRTPNVVAQVSFLSVLLCHERFIFLSESLFENCKGQYNVFLYVKGFTVKRKLPQHTTLQNLIHSLLYQSVNGGSEINEGGGRFIVFDPCDIPTATIILLPSSESHFFILKPCSIY